MHLPGAGRPAETLRRPARGASPARADSLLVVVEAEVRDELLALQEPQRVLQLHQLDEQIVFGIEAGESLVDPEGNVIAKILRLDKKSLYVSVGHKISLEDATRIVKHCISKRGLEPILLAHQEAKRLIWSTKK